MTSTSREKPTALVTGGSSGIGLQIAMTLAADGYAVTVADLHPPADGDAVAVLGYVSADVDDAESMRAAVDAAAVDGSLDVCVANAGVFREFGDFLDADAADWKTTLDVNVLGVLVTLQAAARKMVSQTRRGGALLAISSIAGIRPEPNCPAYSASKSGVKAIVEALANRLGPSGVRVVGIAPGPIQTATQIALQEHRRAQAVPPTLAEATFDQVQAARRPIRRPGYPDDIAHAASFLLSESASWITGVTLSVDGGSHLV